MTMQTIPELQQTLRKLQMENLSLKAKIEKETQRKAELHDHDNVQNTINTFCTLMRIPDRFVLSRSRKENCVYVRTMIIEYLRSYHELPLMRIGKIVDRNHATVIHALKNHRLFMEQIAEYYANYTGIVNLLQFGTPFRYTEHVKTTTKSPNNRMTQSKFRQWVRHARQDDEIELNEEEYFVAMSVMSLYKRRGEYPNLKVRTVRIGNGMRRLIFVDK